MNPPRSDSPLQEGLAEFLSRVIAHLPLLLAAVAILILGWILARIVRSVTKRVGGNVNRVLDRVLRHGPLATARLSTGAVAVLAEIFFWIVILVAFAVAARTAGLESVSLWLAGVVAYLPNLLVGAAIIAIGYFVSVVVGEQVVATAEAAGAGRSALMGKLAQAGLFITALIIGFDQIGVNVTFLVALFAVAVGALCVGFSIAFGLGAQELVGNLVAARSARREIASGDVIRCGQVEGEVLEISRTHVILDTADGRALLPARITSTHLVTIVTPDRQERTGDD